jgi:hypothetical protein
MFENVDWMAFIAPLMSYLMWGLIAIVTLVFVGFIYYYLSFRIKVEVRSLEGSTKDGVFSIGKRKNNYVKAVKGGLEWRKLYPLFNGKVIEPFPAEFLHKGGKFAYAFDVGGTWLPGKVSMFSQKSVDKDGKEVSVPVGILMPVPSYVRNWQSLVHKKHNFEFAQHNFWEDNKMLIMSVIAVGICCLLCAITIYFSYKFAAPGMASLDKLTSAINSLNTVPGIGGG